MYLKQQQQIKRLIKKKLKKKVKIFSKKILRKRTKSWKKIRWQQRLISNEVKNYFKKKKKKIKKRNLYKRFLRKAKKNFHFTNLYLLNAFLTRDGRIKSRKLTGISVFKQKRLSNLIQKARNFGLIPFVTSITKILQTRWQKRQQKLKQEKLSKNLKRKN